MAEVYGDALADDRTTNRTACGLLTPEERAAAFRGARARALAAGGVA